MHPQRVNVDGVSIQAEDHAGEGPPLLLLHFGGANLRMWDPVLPYVRDQYRCITMDLRGHGRSDAPPGGYTLDAMAKDVAAVLSQLDAQPTHVIGSSLGAEVGLALAVRDPSSVRSLVLDGAFESEYGPFSQRDLPSLDADEEMKASLGERLATPEKHYESRASALEELNAFYKKHAIWNPSIEAMLDYGLAEDDRGTFVKAWRKWAGNEYTTHYFETRFEDYYRQLACPAIMLTGESRTDDPRAHEIMEGLCALAQQCTLVHSPGAMHPFGWLLDPEPMIQPSLRFFDSAAERIK